MHPIVLSKSLVLSGSNIVDSIFSNSSRVTLTSKPGILGKVNGVTKLASFCSFLILVLQRSKRNPFGTAILAPF